MKNGFLGLSGFFFLLAGCVSVKIPVEVLRPAPVTLPREVKNVAVCDRTFLSPDQAARIFENGVPSSRFKDLSRLAPNTAAQAVQVELSGFRRFKTTVFQSSEKPSASGGVPPPDSEMLRIWNKDSLFDVVIAVEDFRVEIFTGTQAVPVVVYDIYGYPFTVPRFQDYRNIRINVLWKIYRTSDGSVLHQRRDEHTLFFSADGFSSDEIYRNLPLRNGSVENAAQVMGIRFARNLIPYWQSGTRRIYPGQSDAWLEAADSAYAGNWASAAAQWEKLAKKAPLRILRRQAVYNLAVANEVLGRFDEAEKWAGLGRREFKTREFDVVLLYIDRRRVESRELDVQLNE